MVEYLVGLALLTALIYAAGAGEDSALDQFLAAVRTAYKNFFTAIALPI